MNYRTIEEPCFVCKVEDELGESRGTQSHPINCGWRVKRENKGYQKGLDAIMKFCKHHNVMSYDEFASKMHEIALSALFGHYDMIDNSKTSYGLIGCAMCRSETLLRKEGVQFCSKCGTGHDITVRDGQYYINPAFTDCLVCRERTVLWQEGIQLCKKCGIAHRVLKSTSGGTDYILLDDPAKPKPVEDDAL